MVLTIFSITTGSLPLSHGTNKILNTILTHYSHTQNSHTYQNSRALKIDLKKFVLTDTQLSGHICPLKFSRSKFPARKLGSYPLI